MLIKRRSMISGKVNTLDVACTEEQLARWQAGEKIQDAMPQVPAPLREFLMTGTTPQEWTAMFGRPPRSPKCRARKVGGRG